MALPTAGALAGEVKRMTQDPNALAGQAGAPPLDTSPLGKLIANMKIKPPTNENIRGAFSNYLTQLNGAFKASLEKVVDIYLKGGDLDKEAYNTQYPKLQPIVDSYIRLCKIIQSLKGATRKINIERPPGIVKKIEEMVSAAVIVSTGHDINTVQSKINTLKEKNNVLDSFIPPYNMVIFVLGDKENNQTLPYSFTKVNGANNKFLYYSRSFSEDEIKKMKGSGITQVIGNIPVGKYMKLVAISYVDGGKTIHIKASSANLTEKSGKLTLKKAYKNVRMIFLNDVNVELDLNHPYLKNSEKQEGGRRTRYALRKRKGFRPGTRKH